MSGGAAPARSPSVLVVDDTEGNRYAVSRLLRSAGMHVIEADSAAAAMRRLAERLPDLVVLDINLPDASGHDVCRAIKSSPATAAVPVMHVTASFVSSADQAFGLEHGADAYLTHPLEPAVFLATVRALLRAEGERGRQLHGEQLARRVAEGVAARATLLQDLTAALARTMSAAAVSQVVLTRARAALGAAIGLLTAVDAAGDHLELLGAAGLDDGTLVDWRRYPLHTASPMAEAVRTAAPVSLPTRDAVVARFPARAERMRSLDGAQVSSLHALPLVVDRGPGQRVLGAMLFGWRDEGGVDAADAALIGAVADQCALALERARLYESEKAARAAAEAARAEAEQANAVKAQFLATMSHELRTPLNAIGGHAQLIEMGVHGPTTASQLQALSRIQQSQQHLLGLINSLLSYAKLDAGHVEYELAAVPLPEVVRDVASLVAPQAAARDVALDYADDALRPVVARADAEKLRQVLLNLLSNAVKFTDAGGRVSLSCGPAGDGTRAELRVRDTGRGIAPHHLTRVFDPFIQVGRSLHSPNEGGTGLGLAISRDLAHGMGGDLTVESELGVGSTFTLVLPRENGR